MDFMPITSKEGFKFMLAEKCIYSKHTSWNKKHLMPCNNQNVSKKT